MDFGTIDYSVAIANALSKHCEIDLYCSKYHLEQKDSSILNVLKGKENVKTFCYGKYRIRNVRNILVNYKLCKNIKNRHYDVIHFQEYGTPWMFLFWRICGKCPLVMTVHDPYQHQDLPIIQKVYQDFMQRVFVNRAEKIIVHGQLLKKHILERYPRKTAHNVHVLHHGDFSIMKHWNTMNKVTDSKQKIILFFGAVRRNKGLEYLLKAEPIIRKSLKDFKIIIAGKCDEWHRYQKFITDDAQVTAINNYIPNEELPKYFNEASIVVLPYISATQSGIVPLAFTFGKPVIATSVGAIPEIVENGKTGILVEPRNEKALAYAIIKLLLDDDLREKMSRNAIKCCNERLSWDSIARKTVKIYDEVIQVKHYHTNICKLIS